MRELISKKLVLSDCKNLIKLTAFNLRTDEKNKYYAQDVFLRAIITIAAHTDNSDLLNEVGLYMLYTIDTEQLSATTADKKFIEKIKPINLADKNKYILEIDEQIKKARLEAKSALDEKDMATANKKIAWYRKIRTYYSALSLTLSEFNTLIPAFVRYEQDMAAAGSKNIIPEPIDNPPADTDTSEIMDDTDESELLGLSEEEPISEEQETTEDTSKKKETPEEKLEKIKKDFENNTFKIWCAKCKEKIIPVRKHLVVKNGKTGEKKFIVGECPIHRSKVSYIAPICIKYSDVR